MTTPKNTTPAERRLARREALANSLKTLAITIEKMGANAGFVREAATELLIGNVHLVLEEAWATDDAKLREAMRRDPIETGRTTVTVGAMNIPGRREPGITLQAGADGRLAPQPVVTEAMVERAVDGWHQWWNGYTGPQGPKGQRDAMRFALQQALGVRP